MKIGIIGAGYVGLVTGACFAHLGHHAVIVDNNLQKIAVLKKGKSPIYEPGLNELLKTNIKRKLIEFSTDIKYAVRECEVLFICVNTPPKENGEADLSYVENVSREIAVNLKEYRLIVEKSTVPVQTAEWVEKTIRKNQTRRALFDVASNPEFLREGSAVHDFLNPDRIVFGVSSAKAEKIMRKIYAPIKNAKIVVTDPKSSELIKHASNSFLATKITFINIVSRICDATGADVEKVAAGMGLDPRIGPSFLRAGIGFGGSCFPKDLAAFVRIGEKLGVRFNLLREVLEANETQKLYFVQKIENALWNLKGKTVAVWGLAFKSDTDDIRSAPALDIIRELRKEGVNIQAYDPEAMEKTKEVLTDIKYMPDPYAAVKNADALAVMTEWDEFATADFKKVKKLMKHALIFDGRNMFNPQELQNLGFNYHGMGRAKLKAN